MNKQWFHKFCVHVLCLCASGPFIRKRKMANEEKQNKEGAMIALCRPLGGGTESEGRPGIVP